jgi:hypothetical protein
MGPPAETVWPAAGSCLMTVFSGWSELVSREIPAIRSPSCSTIERASPTVRP